MAVFCTSFAVAQGGDPRRSGYQEMGPALQKMQDDDTANPAMLFVQSGATAWT
ncbi:MAG TPA: sulfur oxidation c-type cytochrome SoxA, partial [Reyranella sp.]|nr:sulfur oxidation c-type cytochrome SoxA [Reyranella sp.]